MKIHSEETSAMEARGIWEVWAIPGPAVLWEFCFGREKDFSLHQLYFWKIIIRFNGHCILRKILKTHLHCDSRKYSNSKGLCIRVCIHA